MLFLTVDRDGAVTTLTQADVEKLDVDTNSTELVTHKTTQAEALSTALDLAFNMARYHATSVSALVWQYPGNVRTAVAPILLSAPRT